MSRNRAKFLSLMALSALCGTALLCAVETNSFSIDLRDACLLNGAVRVAPSSGNASASPMVDGVEMSGWTADSPEWDTSSVADGWHTLSIAGETATPEVLTVNDANVVIHEGVLQSDEIWGADKVHVVRDWVRIPDGRRLVIANGAVVKFCQGAGILNEGTLSSVSAVLTSIADDSVGGDTNLDGGDSAAAPRSYAIRNAGDLNAIHNTVRNATPDSVFASTTISENAFSGCDEITEVVIPANVTYVGENAFGDCENLTRVTFQGNGTIVEQNAFDGCDAVETLNFSSGLPEDEFPVGQSDPAVYVNNGRGSETWGGYTVVDMYANGILEKALLVPTEEGQVGQVLTVTEDGYDWQDIPVDAELDAESENAVQNKVVTAAINELKDADEALAEDVATLQTQTEALEGEDEAMQGDIATLQTQTATLEGTTTTIQGDIATLQGKATALEGAATAIQGELAGLRTADTALQGSIDSLNTAKGTMEANIATLQETVEGLIGIPTGEGGEAGQVLTKTDNGIEWQTINVTVDSELNAESENSVQNKVVTAALDELQDADEAMAEDITDLQTKATALEGADATMQGDIADLQTKAATLEGADEAMQGDIATLQTKAAELEGTNATMQGDIATLQAKTAALEGADTALQGSIDGLVAADTAMQGSIDSLNTAKETMEGDIATLQETVDGLVGVPVEDGEAGQVLTKTDNGIEWQTINVTVDSELNAESENSVQNKVVTAAVNGLKEADENLESDISALSGDLDTQTQLLKDADDAQQNATSALREANEATQNALEDILSSIDGLPDDMVTAKTDIVALQTENGTQQNAIVALQTENGTQQNAIVALQTENQALRSDVDKLNRKMAEILEMLDGRIRDQEIVTLTLEEGWNLVAMPGRVVVNESEKSILDQIEIYTYDKTQQVYMHSDGLEPLASYWMRAPEKCTIHFIVGENEKSQD